MEPEAILVCTFTASQEAIIAAQQPISEKLGPVYEDSPNRPIRRRIWVAVTIVVGLTIIALSAAAVIALAAVFGT